MVNKDGEPATPHKMAAGMKPSVSNLNVLFYPCVLQKATAHVETKILNMSHQPQKYFRGIFVGISQNQKGYLIYVPITHKYFLHMAVYFTKKYSA